MSKALLPKEFISIVFINELKELVELNKYPYQCFILISTGIEFLGKCINNNLKSWEQTAPNIKKRTSKKGFGVKENFLMAINNLDSFNKYLDYCGDEKEFDLYKYFRCGFAHSYKPEGKISVARERGVHLKIFKNNLIIGLPEFAEDFFDACNEVIEKDFPPTDKMNQVYLYV